MKCIGKYVNSGKLVSFMYIYMYNLNSFLYYFIALLTIVVYNYIVIYMSNIKKFKKMFTILQTKPKILHRKRALY